MNNKLYYRAYKFLKLRAVNNNPFKVLEDLTRAEKDKVIQFLSFNHQVKFIQNQSKFPQKEIKQQEISKQITIFTLSKYISYENI